MRSERDQSEIIRVRLRESAEHSHAQRSFHNVLSQGSGGGACKGQRSTHVHKLTTFVLT